MTNSAQHCIFRPESHPHLATLLRIGRAYEQATENDSWRAERPQVLEKM